MVTPLAITTGISKLADNARTIRKGAHPTSYALTARYCIDRTTPLDEDGIDIRRAMSGDLSWCNSIDYKEDILTWHSQDRTLLVCMTNRGKLLLSYEQGVRSGGRVMKLKSPTVRCKHLRMYEEGEHTLDEAVESSGFDV